MGCSNKPRTLRNELLEEAQNDTSKRQKVKLRCYYDNYRFISHGLPGDPFWDRLEGCGSCTIPHPNDETEFSKNWASNRPPISRNAFWEINIPENWLNDAKKWERKN
jgi:hypothetical protein